MPTAIEFVLNGKKVATNAAPTTRLLDVLREEFHLTGTKCGCREGECGACAVIFNGELATSCLIAAGNLPGSEVVTIEGYRETERFQALDAAYASLAAVQCGFCTPGMVLASECILKSNPHPTEAEIREGISGNICRCTGYNAIVLAIQKAAEEGSGLW